ncbi:hypothetical protein [Paenibacillus sp. OAS669]|uniref:hypothetical protein n=1 Tax=Paenibacillus sp. OAS669 TaxID=2663821 RepID=UPI00178908FB|nr:hypothetical protein [Paenibacillus sp. OAS669]MBE1444575.1 hypothetical protein [Paenibacillus sp. OAS669]
MKVWWVLFKKELAFGAKWSGPLWIYLLIVLVLGGASIFLSYRFQSGAMSSLWLMIIYLHFFAPSLYMLMSLKKEWELRPLWLQLPVPGWKLLSAKYAASVLEFAMGLLVSVGMFCFTYRLEAGGESISVSQPYLAEEFHRITGFLQGAHLADLLEFLSNSIGLAILLVLIYLTAASLTSRFGPWRWPIAIGLIGAVIGIEGLFEQTSVFRFIFQTGQITVEYDASLGSYIWMWIHFGIGLFVSVWLLDRKVEV